MNVGKFTTILLPGGSVHGANFTRLVLGWLAGSAVSKPNFASKYSLETGTLKLSDNEHREEKNNNYFNGVSKK